MTDKPQGKTETFSYVEVPKQGQLPPEEFREKIARKTEKIHRYRIPITVHNKKKLPEFKGIEEYLIIAGDT